MGNWENLFLSLSSRDLSDPSTDLSDSSTPERYSNVRWLVLSIERILREFVGRRERMERIEKPIYRSSKDIAKG